MSALFNIKSVVAVTAGVLALSAAASVNAATIARQKVMPVPKASFLNQRVDTVQQLIAQVKAQPSVRARYAKLFHVPESQVVNYIQRNLVESYVPASKTYPVWCASKTGKLYVVKQHFQAGTRVFALRNGTPVMKWACGNPLVSSLPTPPLPRVPMARKPQIPVESVAPYNETVATEYTPEMGLGFPSKMLTSIPGEANSLVPNQLVAGSTELLVPAAKLASRGVIPWLPIAGGATLLSTSNGAGNGGGTTTSTDTQGNGGTSNVVPEPQPIVTLALGLLPLAGLVMLNRRKKLTPVNVRLRTK
ncbi:MAG TPA: hypothetical protein VGK19_06055 [Capsulimonadaceae bacterium]|jgi:hypothetical protein